MLFKTNAFDINSINNKKTKKVFKLSRKLDLKKERLNEEFPKVKIENLQLNIKNESGIFNKNLKLIKDNKYLHDKKIFSFNKLNVPKIQKSNSSSNFFNIENTTQCIHKINPIFKDKKDSVFSDILNKLSSTSKHSHPYFGLHYLQKKDKKKFILDHKSNDI